MIIFQCAHCGNMLRVEPEQAGSKGRCPRCGRAVEAPATSMFGASTAFPGKPPKSKRPKRPRSKTIGPDEFDYLAPPQEPDELGRLGTYRILKVLGSGGMGIVFQAEDTRLKRHVAIKVIKKSIANDPVQRERFIREAQAVAAIEHDNIVPIYTVDEDRGMPFLAMKLLVGESLESRLVRQKTLPIEQVTRIGQEIAEGLAAAHEKGLIHRDVKPANIWLEEGRDRVKLLDFGLAMEFEDEDSRLSDEGLLVGTPQYMSPEQASADIPLDHRTDLFSLGIVLYRMCTGELPFKGRTTLNLLAALATTRPRSAYRLNPEVPRRLSDLIKQLLKKKPEDRPRSARLVVAELADIQQHPEEVVAEVEPEEEEEVIEAEPEPEPEPEPPSRRRVAPRGRRRSRETDEEELARKVIKFAIFAGVAVFLLLAFMVIRNVFFRKSVDTPPTSGSLLQPRGSPHGEMAFSPAGGWSATVVEGLESKET